MNGSMFFATLRAVWSVLRAPAAAALLCDRAMPAHAPWTAPAFWLDLLEGKLEFACRCGHAVMRVHRHGAAQQRPGCGMCTCRYTPARALCSTLPWPILPIAYVVLLIVWVHAYRAHVDARAKYEGTKQFGASLLIQGPMLASDFEKYAHQMCRFMLADEAEAQRMWQYFVTQGYFVSYTDDSDGHVRQYLALASWWKQNYVICRKDISSMLMRPEQWEIVLMRLRRFYPTSMLNAVWLEMQKDGEIERWEVANGAARIPTWILAHPYRAVS